MITEQFKDKNNQIYTSIGLSKAKDLTLNYSPPPHLKHQPSLREKIFFLFQCPKSFQAEHFRLKSCLYYRVSEDPGKIFCQLLWNVVSCNLV